MRNSKPHGHVRPRHSGVTQLVRGTSVLAVLSVVGTGFTLGFPPAKPYIHRPVRQSQAQTSVMLDDVPTAFAAVDDHGSFSRKYKHTDISGSTHIQGMGRYGDYILFDHNREKSEGYWGIGQISTGDFAEQNFPVFPDSTYHHPSAFQVIENYAVVPLEHNDKADSQAYITVYDLSNLSLTQAPPRVGPDHLNLSDGGAESLGIVKSGTKYIVATYDSLNNKIHVWRSNGYGLSDSRFGFENQRELYIFQPKVGGKPVGYQNMGLLTDKSGKIYLVGLRTEGTSTYTDYADLLELQLSQKSFRVVQSRHMYTDTHGATLLGPHFRWGAGIRVVDSQSLEMFCSGRHFEPIGTYLNFFEKKKA